ncbi:MASE3 domain-containing protein [Roseateles oligotrophus]|uniref:histidine kinase n=1 Tax=Roseateles oligotrophus TaxID=1769250 RepID=A0ABT2YDX7_9BURK|nr:MASE3 domain-containing protein [Roseateles oligotrophus]MCV2368221.1 PAS domain-containing protein [Roseateles oligotrophus]
MSKAQAMVFSDYIHPSLHRELRKHGLALAVLSALLLLCWLAPSQQMFKGLAGYPPIHTMLETAAICVAGLVFATAWNAYSAGRASGNLFLLACAFLGVGLLDLAHMLSYAGMPDFVTPNGAEKAINFWLAARSMAALALLAVAARRWPAPATKAGRYAILLALIGWVGVVHGVFLFRPEWMPRTFIVGQGLSAFKLGFEYTLIAINLLTAALLLRRMSSPSMVNAPAFLGVVLAMAMSEFFFTLYGDVTDGFNLMGHLYKIVSYLFLYKAVVVAAIERPYLELDALHGRLQATLAAVPHQVFEVDLTGRVLEHHTPAHVDAMLLAPPGRGSIIACTLDELLPAESVGQLSAALQEALSRGFSYGREMALVSSEGLRWFGLSVARKAALPGEPEALVVLTCDVTERIQAQQDLETSLREKNALLLEVHHRVKNNLQVISSLLRLESGRSKHAPTKTVLQDMQGRVRAMALLHETIYRKGTFAAIDLGSYVREIAADALKMQQLTPGAVQLRLELGSVLIGLDQATPCAMLINELLSNSLKHGFPEGRCGEICISLNPLEEERHWRLRLSDNGLGFPADLELRRSRSLGLQLVGDLAGQMGGKLQVGEGPQAVFTVDFRAELPVPLAIKLAGDRQ